MDQIEATSNRRPSPDDYVKIVIDGVKLRDAELFDQIGKALFTREDGTYNRRDLFYHLFFKLRGDYDILRGMKTSMRKEILAELQVGEQNGKTAE